MRIVDIDKLDLAVIFKNTYQNPAEAKAYDEGIDAVLNALGDLSLCLDWIDTTDDLPPEKKDRDIFLCVLELEAGHKEFRFMKYWLDQNAKGENVNFWVSRHTFYTNNEVVYWADITNLPLPD